MALTTYKKYRDKRQKEFNDLPVFFAFSNDQFDEQLAKLGLTLDDTDKLYRLGRTGGFYLKSDADKIKAWLDGDKLPELMKDRSFCEDAVYSEMCNHEYCYNWQGAFDVMSCFGHVEYGETKTMTDYALELGWTQEQRQAIRDAAHRYNKLAQDNDW